MGSCLGSITSRCLGNEPALLLQTGGRLFSGKNRESGGKSSQTLAPSLPSEFQGCAPPADKACTEG